MPRGGHSNSATLLHVFKEILGLDEDSEPIQALAQKGYTDMPGFLSIPINMFPELVVEEIIEQVVEGQVQKVAVYKTLKRNHINLMQSLSAWHCHLVSKNGKSLTNEEWYNLDREEFCDFRISHPISFKSLSVAPAPSTTPDVHAIVTSKWHHFHLSALGGERFKAIQEVVTTQTALEGEPSTLKMVMMPASSHDLIGSTDPSQAYPDKTKSIVHELDVPQCKSSNCCVMVDLDNGSTKSLPTIASDDPGVAWDPTATITDDDSSIELIPCDDPGFDVAHDKDLYSAKFTHVDPNNDQELAYDEPLGEKDPNAAPPDPAPDEDVDAQLGTNDGISCTDEDVDAQLGTNDGISCTSSFLQESDSPQFYGSFLSDYIGDLQDYQEEIIFYEEDTDGDDDSTCFNESITWSPFSCYVDLKGTLHFPIKTANCGSTGSTGSLSKSDVYLFKTGERFDNQQDDFLTIRLVQDQHGFIPQVAYYEGKGSMTNLSSGHMGDSKIKVDYGGFIQVSGKQKLQTVYELSHSIFPSDQGWNPGILHDYKHPSTWPENLFSITGFAYMDKNYNSYGDYLHQLLAEIMSCSFYGDGPPFLNLEKVIGLPKKQVFTHGYSTQLKKPNYHHAYEAKNDKNLAFHYGYGKHYVADAFSMMPCGFQESWHLVKPHFGWTVKCDMKGTKVNCAPKEVQLK